MSQLEQFRNVMIAHGLNPPRNIVPGKFHRFPGNGKQKGNNAGWAKLFNDCLGGAFGDYSTGLNETWQAERTLPFSQSEREEFVHQVAEVRSKRETDTKETHTNAAQNAAHIFAKCPTKISANRKHGYIKAKGINFPRRTTIYYGDLIIGGMKCSGSLLIPLRNIDGEITTLQFVSETGEKRFLPNGKKAGSSFIFGDRLGETLLICEGIATGASLHVATALPVACAFDAGNLIEVAKALRTKYSEMQIVICADDDVWTEGNPGIAKAREAAALVNGSVATPIWSGERIKGRTDFNDLALDCGIEAVAQIVNDVIDIYKADRQNSNCTVIEQKFADEPHSEVTEYRDFFVPSLAGSTVRDGTKITRPLTELGNAQRLRDRYRNQLRYVADRGAWMFWDGKTWRRDWNASIVRNLAGNLIESIYREGSDFINDGAAFASWARTSAKQTTINNAINLASDFPDIQLPEMAIDGDCMVCGFNKAKNVINLKSGEIRDAEMGDYVTRSIGVSEIGDANKALRWMRFLDEVFNGDAELIDWIKRFFGYCMTGRMDEQFFVFLYGFGANGKSVFVEILSRLSAEYSRNIQPETLMMQSKTGSGASPDIARLAGARVVTANETESGKSLAESLIKQIVGGDTMTARENYGQPFEFRPVCKLVFAGNHKPVIRSVDNGIWRRVRMIPFARVFSPGERDPKLIDKLIHELPHIAAWAIDGCLEWQRRGLHDIPAAIAGSTSEYREEMDILGRWIEERTHSSPNHILTTAKAYTDYREWALGYGYNAITEAAFGRQLSERGIEKGRTSKARHYKGIDLIDRPYCV